MAVNHILMNDVTPDSRQWRSFVSLVNQTIKAGNDLLDEVNQMKDSGAVGQYIADRFQFGVPPGSSATQAGVVATAQAAVAELESLMGKLNTTGGAGVTTFNVLDAIKQFVAKFG